MKVEISNNYCEIQNMNFGVPWESARGRCWLSYPQN